MSPTQNQVNFDPNSEVKSISIPTLKQVNFACPRHENQVSFDPDSKPCNFRPPHKNQVNYNPYTEIESTPILRTEITSTSTTHTTTKSISMPTLKPCYFQAVLLYVLYVPVHVLVIQQQYV